jgi:hypothetical protein
MAQEDRLLYGEFVAGFTHAGEVSTGEREMHEMEEQVRRMTEEAACLLAQQRGFGPGYQMRDWVEAERLVRQQLGLDQ